MLLRTSDSFGECQRGERALPRFGKETWGVLLAWWFTSVRGIAQDYAVGTGHKHLLLDGVVTWCVYKTFGTLFISRRILSCSFHPHTAKRAAGTSITVIAEGTDENEHETGAGYHQGAVCGGLCLHTRGLRNISTCSKSHPLRVTICPSGGTMPRGSWGRLV